MILAGVDGCPGGWVAVISDEGLQRPRTLVVSAFSELRQASGQPVDVICIDIPIGLAEKGPRQADLQGRMLLPGRASCVFPAPERPLLKFAMEHGIGEPDGYATTNSWSRAKQGHGVQKQAFNIFAKVAEVDSYLQGHRGQRVYEVHPEVSFAAMNGGEPMRLNKKGVPGRAERIKVLAERFPASISGIEKPRGAKQDDLYDAFAALWTASRIARGEAKRIPAEPERDSTGLDMAIWY